MAEKCVMRKRECKEWPWLRSTGNAPHSTHAHTQTEKERRGGRRERGEGERVI